MTAKDIRWQARNILYNNWGLAVGSSLVAALLGGLVTGANVDLTLGIESDQLPYLPQFVFHYLKFIAPVALILALVQFFLGGMIRLGYCRFLLNLYDYNEASLKDLFSQKHRFWDGFCLSLLQSLFVFLWSLLFVIPGIIAAYRYAMAPFILSENENLSPLEAINESKYLMDGHKFDLFILELSFIGWVLLNIFTLGIGSLLLNPYTNLSQAAFYRTLSS